MSSFASIVESSEEFRRVKGRARLTDRESALLAVTFQRAEYELSNWKVKYERKSGQALRAKDKTKFLGLLLAPGARRAIGAFLTRPYIEYYKPKLLQHTVPESEESGSEPSDGMHDAIITERPPAHDALKAASPTQQLIRNDSAFRSIVNAFSGWQKASLIFVESSFARMSPLTTAIWFGLIVVGAVAFGWAQRTYLLASYDYYKNEASLVQPLREELKIAKSDVGDARNKGKQAELDRDTATSSREQTKAELSRKELEWQERERALRAEHANVQELLTKNADEALRTRAATLESQARLFAGEKKTLLDQIEEQNTRVTKLTRDIEGNAKRIQELESLLNQESGLSKTEARRADSFQTAAQDGRALAAFTKASLALVGQAFFERRVSNFELQNRRDEFSENFAKLRADHAKAIERFDIPASVK